MLNRGLWVLEANYIPPDILHFFTTRPAANTTNNLLIRCLHDVTQLRKAEDRSRVPTSVFEAVVVYGSLNG